MHISWKCMQLLHYQELEETRSRGRQNFLRTVLQIACKNRFSSVVVQPLPATARPKWKGNIQLAFHLCSTSLKWSTTQARTLSHAKLGPEGHHLILLFCFALVIFLLDMKQNSKAREWHWGRSALQVEKLDAWCQMTSFMNSTWTFCSHWASH